MYQIALIHLKKENFARAVQILERVTGLNPHDINARYQLGLTLEDMGKTEKAKEVFKRILDLFSIFDEYDDIKPSPEMEEIFTKIKEKINGNE